MWILLLKVYLCQYSFVTIMNFFGYCIFQVSDSNIPTMWGILVVEVPAHSLAILDISPLRRAVENPLQRYLEHTRLVLSSDILLD